jgi:hypothetical protein
VVGVSLPRAYIARSPASVGCGIHLHALLAQREVRVTLDKITSVLATGGQHLGDIVYWTLAEARLDRSTLEQIWASALLSPAFLPEPPTAEKALKAAVREAAVGQPDRLIRLGLENETQVIFAVVRETKHEHGSVSYMQETRIVLDRATERVTADVPAHDLASTIAVRFGELRSTHTPDDVRRAMMKALDACAAVTLRDHGGVYWCPAPFADTVRRLQSAIERIGSSRFYILPVHASADATRALGDAAKLAIEDELAALKSEVEGFVASPPDRPSTLVRRLDAFEGLHARANLYRDILQVHVQDLDKTLADLTSRVENLLDQKAAA